MFLIGEDDFGGNTYSQNINSESRVGLRTELNHYYSSVKHRRYTGTDAHPNM